MNGFIMAALPWVLGGLTLAIYAVITSTMTKKREEGSISEETKSKMQSSLIKNMCVGMGLGYCIGMSGDAGFGPAVGITGGLLIGVLLGFVFGLAGRE